MLKKNNNGFTLIEVIIVIVIVSIIMTTAALTIGNTIGHNKLKYASRQLFEELRYAQQQAIMQSMVLGFSISNERYQFFYFDSGGSNEKPHWVPFANNNLLRAQSLPDLTEASFESSQSVSEKNNPMAVISSDGQFTPFTLTMGAKDQTMHFKIIALPGGNLQFMDDTTNE